MTFTDLIGGRSSAAVPQHNRLRGLEVGNPHPQYALDSHTHPASDIDSEAWTAYTPTWSNLTPGNATVSCSFVRIGRTIHYRGSLSFGSTSSISGAIMVSLPADVVAGVPFIGSAKAEDSSASYARTVGLAEVASTVWGQNINFTSNGTSNWNTTSPFTWAVDDGIAWSITYEAAA